MESTTTATTATVTEAMLKDCLTTAVPWKRIMLHSIELSITM